jgi:hypothetical protein
VRGRVEEGTSGEHVREGMKRLGEKQAKTRQGDRNASGSRGCGEPTFPPQAGVEEDEFGPCCVEEANNETPS